VGRVISLTEDEADTEAEADAEGTEEQQGAEQVDSLAGAHTGEVMHVLKGQRTSPQPALSQTASQLTISLLPDHSLVEPLAVTAD